MEDKRNIVDRRINSDRRKSGGRRKEDNRLEYPKDSNQFKGWVFSAINHLLNRFGMTPEELLSYVESYVEENGKSN